MRRQHSRHPADCQRSVAQHIVAAVPMWDLLQIGFMTPEAGIAVGHGEGVRVLRLPGSPRSRTCRGAVPEGIYPLLSSSSSMCRTLHHHHPSRQTSTDGRHSMERSGSTGQGAKEEKEKGQGKEAQKQCRKRGKERKPKNSAGSAKTVQMILR